MNIARIRDKDGGCGSASLPNTLLNIGEDGETKVLLTSLLWVGSTNDLCACTSVSILLPIDARQLFVWAHTVLDRLLRMETGDPISTFLNL